MKLGITHPDYLLDQLTSEQLADWEAYNIIEPIGEWRSDFRMASLSSLMVNLFKRLPHSKRGQKDSTPNDFMPEFYKEKVTPDNVEKQAVEDMKNVLLQIGVSKHRRRKGDPPIKRKK